VIRAGLGLAALGLGLLAALAGQPTPPGRVGPALAAAIDRGEGRLGIVELARWLRDRRAGLLIVDLRGDSAYQDFHLPRAERMALTDLAGLPPDRSRTIVVYGDTGPEPAQAWVLLQARGVRDAFYVPDAVAAWLAGVMHPLLPSDATEAERALWPEVRELSQYFGGLPRAGGPRAEVGLLAWAGAAAAPVADVKVMLDKARRQGCGF
jgi:rhodanese-related sulfurtransferase